MSYEGYTQNLCDKGHLTEFGCGDDKMHNDCILCGADIVFYHNVDQTNGVLEQENGLPYPETVEYPFEFASYEDVWQRDHYGTKYATRRRLYKIPGVKR